MGPTCVMGIMDGKLCCTRTYYTQFTVYVDYNVQYLETYSKIYKHRETRVHTKIPGRM